MGRPGPRSALGSPPLLNRLKKVLDTCSLRVARHKSEPESRTAQNNLSPARDPCATASRRPTGRTDRATGTLTHRSRTPYGGDTQHPPRTQRHFGGSLAAFRLAISVNVRSACSPPPKHSQQGILIRPRLAHGRQLRDAVLQSNRGHGETSGRALESGTLSGHWLRARVRALCPCRIFVCNASAC